MSRKKSAKCLAALALGMTMLFGMAGGTVNAAAPLHYFMQQPGNYESATPYGNNEKPAIMYRPVMQRFIMKSMARASLFSSFMVAA